MSRFRHLDSIGHPQGTVLSAASGKTCKINDDKVTPLSVILCLDLMNLARLLNGIYWRGSEVGGEEVEVKRIGLLW
jgi:hypothetical protein